MLAAHVDDVMWAAEAEYEKMISDFLGNFVIKKESVGNFCFCGREYSQKESRNTKVSCTNNTEKILPICFQRGA